MFEDDYRDFEPLDEYTELNDIDDDDDFFEFIPPYTCPLYRQQFPFPGGGLTPPRPPFGPPGGGAGGFPGGGPGGFPGGGQGAPATPPPNFTPSKAQAQSLGAPGGGVSTYAVDAGSLRPCRFRFVYLWLRNGNAFWAYLTFVGRNSISGFRWTGRRWVYFGIDTRRIDFFVCY